MLITTIKNKPSTVTQSNRDQNVKIYEKEYRSLSVTDGLR